MRRDNNLLISSLEKSIDLRIKELNQLSEPYRSRTILTVRQDLQTLQAVDSERAGECGVGLTSHFVVLYQDLVRAQSLFSSVEVEEEDDWKIKV